MLRCLGLVSILVICLLAVTSVFSDDTNLNSDRTNQNTALLADSCDNQYPGDIDGDDMITPYDITYLLNYLTHGGPEPPVPANADVDGDCDMDFDDIDYLDAYLNLGGPAPVECTCIQPDTCAFQTPGDFDADGMIDIIDYLELTNYIYLNGFAPPIPANADFNGDCLINIYDLQAIDLYLTIYPPPDPIDCTCLYPVKGCCLGIRGNVNFDAYDIIDISDLTMLVDFMFGGLSTLPCEEEADINGIDGVDISDLVMLVEYQFGDGPEPVLCD